MGGAEFCLTIQWVKTHGYQEELSLRDRKVSGCAQNKAPP